MADETRTEEAISFYEEKGSYRGIAAWMMSTDHKRIGIMYLTALLSFFFVGVTLGFLIRLSLLSPGWLMQPRRTMKCLPYTGSSRSSSSSSPAYP